MGWPELRKKFGGHDRRSTLNGAVRVEIPGGAELIEGSRKMHEAFNGPRQRSPDEMACLRRMLALAGQLLDLARDEILRRYQCAEDWAPPQAAPPPPTVRLADLAPPPPPEPIPSGEAWRAPPSAVARMGAESHQAIARDHGVSGETVSRAAAKLGVVGRKKVSWTDAALRVLAETPDNRKAAAKLAISLASVKTARSRYKDRIKNLME